MWHDYRTIPIKEEKMKSKKIIRDMAAYNNMLQEIKAVIAAEGISHYKVVENTGSHLYGGTACYSHSVIGAYTSPNGQTFSTEYYNEVGTISSEGNLYEVEIPRISKDVALRAIRLALKEAFSLPEFVGNEQDCPSDDDGMWWNNHRAIPSETMVEVNNHKWIVYYQD